MCYMCYINLTIFECGKIATKHMCCSSAQMRVANMSVFPCNQTIRNLGGYQLMQPRHPNQSPNVPNRDIQTNHQMCPTETSKPITKCALQPVCNVLRPAKPAPGMLKLGPDNQRRPYMCWPTILWNFRNHDYPYIQVVMRLALEQQIHRGNEASKVGCTPVHYNTQLKYFTIQF
jgi:hypothetical protein